jgi:hypothetical protein
MIIGCGSYRRAPFATRIIAIKARYLAYWQESRRFLQLQIHDGAREMQESLKVFFAKKQHLTFVVVEVKT